MTFLSRLFAKKARPAGMDEAPHDSNDPLIPVPIPALGALLLSLERQKGEPLTEGEVVGARDKAVCLMMPRSAMLALEAKRGYKDVDPENVWVEWLALKAEISQGGA